MIQLDFEKYLRRKDDIRLVFYHGIGERTSPFMKYLDDEIPEDVFKHHLDYLLDKYTILSLENVIGLIEDNRIIKDKPICSISFDDGLETVFTKAYPLLKERNIPFTVFLNTSVIGNNNLLWLHLMSYLLNYYKPQNISKILNELIDVNLPKVPQDATNIIKWCRKNYEYVSNKEILKRILHRFGLDIKKISNDGNMYLTWDQIDEMKCYNASFYSHTHNHAPLNIFSNKSIVIDEIGTSLSIMKEHGNNSELFVSFPFGMNVDYGKQAIEYAFALGHKYIVEVGNGINSYHRIIDKRILSRVCLGNINKSKASLYSAIELRPLIKEKLKLIIKKNSII
jgi:peptidoglycan/xylan/chitin deacetylase (PgdA/CDA1 family)